MVVLVTQSKFGHAPPPQTPYSIISNLPGWDVAQSIRDGNKEPLTRVKHIYPRFFPMGVVAEFGLEVKKFLGMEDKGIMLYLNPAIWPYTQVHVAMEKRGPHRMKAKDLRIKCVEVAGHRVYAVLFDPPHTPAVMLTWGNPGLGLSPRGARELSHGVEGMKEVVFTGDDLPEPTWTPESPAHQGIRERIAELLHRAAIDPEKVQTTPDDVFLYPSGMAPIFHMNTLLLKYRPGTVVVLGIVFHNTYHHLVEECPHGWKHFGKVDEEGLDQVEEWLKTQKKEDRAVSYAFVEIPGNPTLDTPDLDRLKRLSEEYGFVFIVDETVSGFANVDVLAQSDFLLTSLTKSFSGEANVMGGSVALNPLSPHYSSLWKLLKASHRNELFGADAEVLLANSRALLQRTQTLNSNALAMAKFLHDSVGDPSSPVINVQHPALLPSKAQYDVYLRRSTPELPAPGYGCLLNVEFESLAAAKAFYDRCGFYPSPHLAGHVTLMFPYNMFVFCKKPAEKAYMLPLGVREESVRISAGLEDEGDLIDTLKDALSAATEVKRGSE